MPTMLPLLSLLLLASLATARNAYISPTGTDSGACASPTAPCATLMYALQQIDNYDTVFVMDGTYTDAANFGAINVSVTVAAVDGASPVFDASAAQNGMYFAPAAEQETLSATFVSLTFANWTGHQGTVGLFQGYSSPSTRLILSFESCTFTNNYGSLSVFSNASVTISQCTFTSGGLGADFAMSFEADFASSKRTGSSNSSSSSNIPRSHSSPRSNLTLTLTDTIIEGFDTGIYVQYDGASFVLQNTTLHSCRTCAMMVHAHSGLSISDSRFIKNGCAMYVGDDSESESTQSHTDDDDTPTLTITDSLFDSNIGITGLGNGGGALTLQTANPISISSTVFTNNHGPYDGGAIACFANSLTVEDSTFIGNSAANGGAVFCSSDCQFSGSHNVVRNNHEDKNTGPCRGFPSV